GSRRMSLLVETNQSLRMSFTVAAWEFGRYFKLKDQIVGLVSLLMGATIAYGAVQIAKSASKVELAILGASQQFELPKDGKLTVAVGKFSEEEWRAQVLAGDVDGLLIFSQPDSAQVSANRSSEVADVTPTANTTDTQSLNRLWSAQLFVRQTPTWLEDLQPSLQADRMRTVIEASGVAPQTLASIAAPAQVDIIELSNRAVSKSDRLVAFCILGATLLTSWIGLAYMLTGITGEKQQRVTEQIVSAIRPQMWIDGKLLGITGAAIGSLAFVLVSGMIAALAASLFRYELPIPGVINRWDLIPILAFFYVAGVLFWNCFYAGVAAVINDPNTSSRTSLLFLPMLPLFAAGLVTSQPDGALMRALSLLPGTSVTAMPMRLVLGEVSTPDLLLSITLLLLGIATLRWVAGRVFAAGIMLYGKEPSWLDIAKWAFGSSNDRMTLNASTNS
ncbi:MAG: ABC transporter permease, partial [Pirellulaceae bacterium]|nr:ABC transporter permease [Pirellulaceae bacterium]